MNTFTITVMINNLAADYDVFFIGKKFKATLVQTLLGDRIPSQISFWKENGQWNTSHHLTQHAIYQFGSCIDNHLTALEVKNLKKVDAA